MSEMTVRTGAMKKPASTRGTTSLRIGIGAERAQRVDLIGHDHRAELGGDARADAAGQHQPGQHRPELLDHRRADQPADERPRAELIERHAALQRQHGAGEEPGQQHDGQRPDADRVELLDDVAEVERPARRCRESSRPAGARTPAPRGRRPSASRRAGRARGYRPAVQAGEAQLAVAQRLERVAQRRGALEVEIRGRGLHLALEPGDLGVELGLRPERLARLARRPASM